MFRILNCAKSQLCRLLFDRFLCRETWALERYSQSRYKSVKVFVLSVSSQNSESLTHFVRVRKIVKESTVMAMVPMTHGSTLSGRIPVCHRDQQCRADIVGQWCRLSAMCLMLNSLCDYCLMLTMLLCLEISYVCRFLVVVVVVYLTWWSWDQ